MKKTHSLLISAAVLCAVFAFGNSVLAAELFVTPQIGTYGLNAAFSVDIKINSQGDSINAAQAHVVFPATVLEVSSVSTLGSVFGFWPEEPSFSNENGTIDFIGGTVNGVSGASLHVLTVAFRAKSAGEAAVSLDDGAITIDDGTGTNILTKTTGANYRIATTAVVPPPPPPPAVPEVVPGGTQQPLPLPGEPIPSPVIIERVPEPAKELPEMPIVAVPLYPDPNGWFNVRTPFNATWALPADITDVATALNANPNFAPTRSEQLFDNKIFDSAPEGVSYLHVRFKNAIGWGPTAHYRLAIDTAPPAPFTIESASGFETDDPAPIFQFDASDALSGIRHYLVKIGDAEAFEWKSGRLQLPLQEPGTRKVFIRAVDLAGNSVSSSVDLTTIPIASPVITFITEKVFFGGEEGVTVKGAATPGVDVHVFLMKAGGGLVKEQSARADGNGNWDLAFLEPLGIGKYAVSAQARDSRGALSLAVSAPSVVAVKAYPIIKFGALEIGAGGTAFILLVILIAGFAAGYWYFRERQRRLHVDVTIASRDQMHLYDALNADIEKMSEKFDEMNKAEKKFILERINENVQKMKKYLVEEIKNIGNGGK